jgi:hypothetical protein
MADHCPACGSLAMDEQPGTGPHAGKLVCHDCGRFVRWTSAAGRDVRPLTGLWKNEGEGYGVRLKEAVSIPAGARLLLFKVKDPKEGGPALLLRWVPPEGAA